MRIDGMRPALAASYSQVRETPSRAATSAGLRRSGVLICGPLTWVIDRERPKTANEFEAWGLLLIHSAVAQHLQSLS
jgi:hypothetical protein